MKNFFVVLLILILTSSRCGFATENVVDEKRDLSLSDSLPGSGKYDDNECLISRKYKRKVLTGANFKNLGAEYQFYVESVRNKIEKLTNDLYIPNEVRKSKREISARVEVVIFRTGALCGVTILNSSGSAVFDEMIRNVVKQVSPFSQFPEHMANETDVIHLIRAWTFQRY